MRPQAFRDVSKGRVSSDPPTLACHKHREFGAPEGKKPFAGPMISIDIAIIVMIEERGLRASARNTDQVDMDWVQLHTEL